MRPLTLDSLSIGLSPRAEASPIATKNSPRMLLDTTGVPEQRRVRPSLRQVVPPVRTDTETVQDVEAALLKLQDVFFASCADYPSDDHLQQRIRTHCRKLEASLPPSQLRAWRSGRDCLLARLGFRLLRD